MAQEQTNPSQACSVKTVYDKDGDKVTSVNCGSGKAVYKDGRRSVLTLTTTRGTPKSDTPDTLELRFSPMELHRFTRTDSGKQTVRLAEPYNDVTAVYCDPSFATTAPFAIDRIWEDTKNASHLPKKSILADQAQDFAKAHPDVVREIQKVNPRLGYIGGKEFTLEEALAMKDPQFAACPATRRQNGESIIIEKRVRQ